ncbi:MAG: peptide ABC transporter ATP-binding protein [Rhodospirillaceae bacterium]|nr:peptide ABC transporter ATP-binding protein [Rhodospirillaceae bacterium]
MTRTLLRVEGLTVTFPTRRGPVVAVDEIAYRMGRGETLGVVGESGCGKTVSALALIGLADPAAMVKGRALLDGTDLLTLDAEALRRVRGRRIAMIFQEPMTALNPVYTIGDQVAEALVVHEALSADEARERAVALLEQVGMPAPRRRLDDYPHQLSGGMRQRAMIAMALACKPDLLIADEPTTALDVTVQAQILDLMLALQDEFGMAIQFISHDLGVISGVADTVAVMYAGRIVERAPANGLFEEPLHPYTRGLLATIPRLDARPERLPAIAGTVPDLGALPSGCRYRNRCPLAMPRCAEQEPELIEAAPGREVACWAVTP